jgi:hypothetical protein
VSRFRQHKFLQTPSYTATNALSQKFEPAAVMHNSVIG